MSDAAIPYDYIRKAGKAGELGTTLIAIAAEGKRGRVYVEPLAEHIKLANSADPIWRPETQLPENPRDFKTPNYGLTKFGDLFTDRQLVALNTFSDLVKDARAKAEQDALREGMSSDDTPLRDGGQGAKAYAEAVSIYLAFAADRAADAWSAQVGWRHSVEASRSTFARQALPMLWDFVELNPFSSSNGNWRDASIEWVHKSLGAFCPSSDGRVVQGDAQTVKYPGPAVVSTDPPYYDNIGYAELSDYFFVWLRRHAKEVYPELTATLAVPKAEELVATPYRHGGKDSAEACFVSGM
jgi:putative DNA methylase